VRGDVQASSQRTLVGFKNVGGTYFTPKYSYSGVSSGSLKAFAAGYTVWTQSLANYYSYSKSVSLNLFTPSPSITVWVGPVPVTVKGNVGFGGSLTISGRLLPGQATMNGNAACWANGWASAGIGVSGYSISIVLKLSFGRQDVLLKFDVKCFGEPTASMSYWLNAVALKIKLKLEAWPFEWTKTLASWSSSPYSKVLF